MFARLTLILGLILMLSGCLNTQNRKVLVEDEIKKEKLAKAAKNIVKKTYEEEVTEEMERKKFLILPLQVRVDDVHRENTRRRISAIRNTIAEDPWEDFEIERERVLNRPWTDTTSKKDDE